MVKSVGVIFQASGKFRSMDAMKARNLMELYGGPKVYNYRSPFDLQVGDVVVVQVNEDEVALAQVVVVNESTPKTALKSVVQKVDMERVNLLRNQAVEKSQIIETLEKKLKERDRFTRYSVLADMDPEAAELIARLKVLEEYPAY